jgi:peptidoglycan/xylan/chitin deacetylase (PgdA/CDA1 family)
MKDSAKTIDVPVLAYHQIEVKRHQRPSYRGLVVDATSFERQMSILRTFGYRAVSLIDLAKSLAGDLALPSRPVVITFDDGYAGAYNVGFPILRRYDFVATLFLIAEDFIDNSKRQNQRAFPIMTRTQVAEMVGVGFHVGSHSVSHPRLTELSDSAVHTEITNSRKILENTFRCEVNAFCYPYGVYDSGLETRVQDAGYACACSTRFGRRHSAKDKFGLRRIPVGADQGIAQFMYRLLWARDE